MFDFPSDNLIKSHREMIQAKVLGSFHSDDPNVAASLIKGMTMAEFEAAYPTEKWERFSFNAMEKFKADFKKANETDLVKAESELESLDSKLTTVVVQEGHLKKLVFVRQKATA
jgi:hypothetical protein